MSDADKFRPTRFDPAAYAIKRSTTDKKFKVAYDHLEAVIIGDNRELNSEGGRPHGSDDKPGCGARVRARE